MVNQPIGTFVGPEFAGWDATGRQLFNHYTVDAGDDIPKAVRLLLDKGFEAGLIPHKVDIEFIR